MADLTAPRNTPAALGDVRKVPLPANGKIFQGAMVQINNAGYAVKGAATSTSTTIGRAEETVDNTGGANGAASITVRRGIFRYGNSASGDLIARTEIGKTVYVVDDQTVAKTNNAGARPAAGICFDVDAQGVWVEFQ